MKKADLILRPAPDIYSPIQDVAPSAVRIAEAIDTMICTINLVVSFFVIISEI